MNLNQTFCASDCQNHKCFRMLSYSKCKAAEKQSKPLSHADLSKDCKDYIAKGR